ncbi:MAG: UPF0175 family protein [Deinococcota bacterium]
MDQLVTLDIPQDILDAAQLTVEEAKQELALSLYASGRLSVGKARELAGLSLWKFRQRLAARKIPVHYGVDDLADDADVAPKRICTSI